MHFIHSIHILLLRLVSFFDEQKVAEIDSEVNHKLDVSWVNGVKVLNVENANYSFGSLYKTFRKTFNAAEIENTSFGKVLILGNAAGGAAYLLRKEYGFEGTIHGVELDKKIIEISKMHFPDGYAAADKVFNEDGYEFVMKLDEETYDFVIFDIYKDLEIPGKFQTREFIERLHRIMARNSMLIYNKVIRSRKTKTEGEFLESTMQQLFSDFRVISIGNFTENRMFVCRK